MFRNPREQLPANGEPFKIPSTGRPPTPPHSTPGRTTYATTDTYTLTAASATPVHDRSKAAIRAPGRTSAMAAGKAKGKGNSSILNFFKKSDSFSPQNTSTREDRESLFLEDETLIFKKNGSTQTPTPPKEPLVFIGMGEKPDDMRSQDQSPRFNEEVGPIKKRRLEFAPIHSPTTSEGEKGAGGDDGYEGSSGNRALNHSDTSTAKRFDASQESLLHGDDKDPKSRLVDQDSARPSPPALGESHRPVPSLKREATSVDILNEFDGMNDFIDEEFFEDGEEFIERRWMEEQQRFEDSLDDDPRSDHRSPATPNASIEDYKIGALPGAESQSCPVCSVSFEGISDQDASLHVNGCLDGNAPPLPRHQNSEDINKSLPEAKSAAPPPHKRFQRATIAKPGQDNPFDLKSSKAQGSSAFSKLMSGHAEDIAWSTAAASELASRGKPAYKRTCPFYKIMPGLFICVDAFRYGAVEGCKAYFLSHFHSDHYIGLTSSWCHGPIYCSHVTANLVRRQLRVDPKWVFDLEFDCKMEVPNTQGVQVTMIPANHCPGSSLYLFEKVVGQGKHPKVHRILHCGDFRACVAHVQHPLLRPDVVDTVTGRNRQQKLDVCYLDTTYLTPKYAFPSQEEVIRACADMCVSLSKTFVDESDGWESTKRERTGQGMAKFVQQTSDIVQEGLIEDHMEVMKNEPPKGKKPRGRLLVIVGTYSIGKERICLGVARALNSKIYAPPNKQKIVAALEDPALSARMTDDPLEAQVHMQMLMEIRAETLADYLTGFKPHFSRIVGFRPSGWNYRPPNSRFTDSPLVQTVLHSDNWKSRYTMADLVPQRGSTREANCFGVPYSEHSSFRELTMFCCALRIDKIIPTVNVGSAKSREKMKGWCEKWAMDKKKNGLFTVEDGQIAWK